MLKVTKSFSLPILVTFMINLIALSVSSTTLKKSSKFIPPLSIGLIKTSVALPRFELLNFISPEPGYCRPTPEVFTSVSKLYFTVDDVKVPSAPEVPDEPCPNVTVQ